LVSLAEDALFERARRGLGASSHLSPATSSEPRLLAPALSLLARQRDMVLDSMPLALNAAPYSVCMFPAARAADEAGEQSGAFSGPERLQDELQSAMQALPGPPLDVHVSSPVGCMPMATQTA
jgi:hypothetical protein